MWRTWSAWASSQGAVKSPASRSRSLACCLVASTRAVFAALDNWNPPLPRRDDVYRGPRPLSRRPREECGAEQRRCDGGGGEEKE